MNQKMKNKTYLLTNLDKDTFKLAPFTLRELPSKVYGNMAIVRDKVLKSFKERKGNLGVLFSGLKGNSKTLHSIEICQASGVPVVAITEPFTGDVFKNFLCSLEGEHIIFIDEFEKVYNTTELQEEFLSILDGVMGDKKMFLFTSNSTKISQYLLNRPSRIYYHFKYNNIDPLIVDEIIKEELKESKFEEDLRDLLLILGSVSYDVLLNLIDETNRFKISPKELIKDLNIQVEQTDFTVTMLLDGKRFTSKVNFNPLTVESFYISYEDEKGYYKSFYDYPKNYTRYAYKGSFVFESSKNKLTFTPYKPYTFEL